MPSDLPDASLESPLIERLPGDAVAQAVSIERCRGCNDVAVQVGPPVTAVLPPEPWAHGLIFPVDHAALTTHSERRIIVRCDLLVESGHIGIMGVAEGLEQPTTTETAIGPGRTTACLTLDPAPRTSAIVLRNIGDAGTRPRVTVSAIGAYRAGPPHLALRRHNLGFDLFVVLAPPKTATQTLEQTLRELAPGVQVRRAHGVSEAAFPRLPERAGALLQSQQNQTDDARVLEKEIGAVRNLGGRIAFVTSVREPIDQAIAGLFQNLPVAIRAFRELHAAGPGFVDLLATGLAEFWRRKSGRAPDGSWFWGVPHLPAQFFGGEFRCVTGVDLLAHPVDRVAGFTLLQQDREAVLMFRYEDGARGFGAGLAALTGRSHVTLRNVNRSDDKPYARLYHEFRAKFRIPADLAEEIYSRDPYLRHFYTPEEISAFKAKWSAQDPVYSSQC